MSVTASELAHASSDAAKPAIADIDRSDFVVECGRSFAVLANTQRSEPLTEGQQSAANFTADAADSSEGTTVRLVIRARILPDHSPPRPTQTQFVTRRLGSLIFGVVALLVLAALAITLPRPNSERTHRAQASIPVKQATTPIVAHPAAPAQTASTPTASTAHQEPPISAINEVLPTVPRSALNTIHGTIRVSIRVVLNQEGAVTSAASQIAGPSRYFERLSLQSAQKWTFTPSQMQEQRTMLVKFEYTRAGVSARAEP
jgi:TonB family protein